MEDIPSNTKNGLSDVSESLEQKGGLEMRPCGQASPLQSTSEHSSEQPSTTTTTATTTKRSSLLKPKSGEQGYDFSESFEQSRRVRFKFGVHSLAVEATLAKLFESLTMECSGVLVQPQWKHFRHFDMLKNDQIRLSNGIWRSWHIKYQKGLEPLFCTFSLNAELDEHTRPEAVVLEGKYHKRKVEAVAREYRKWRMFHREKFRQGGCRPDPALADLLDNAQGDELGGGELGGRNTAQGQAMQVDPPMPGFIQLEELTDPFLMNLGQDYTNYNASSNAMFQPKMDVLSSALDELLDKLEPMEVLLSRTNTSTYPSSLNFPPSMAIPPTSIPPVPLAPPHLAGVQQLLPSPMTPSLSPHTAHHSQVSPLTGFMNEHPNSLYSSPSHPPPPPHSQPHYFTQQQLDLSSTAFYTNDTVTHTQTPPPQPTDDQFSMPPGILGGSGIGLPQQTSPFQYQLKRDQSADSLQSPPSGPPSGPPSHLSPTSPNYNPSIISNRSPSSYSNMLLSSGHPISGETQQPSFETSPDLSSLQPSIFGVSGKIATPTGQQVSYRTLPSGAGSGGSGEGAGGMVGSKRKEGTEFHQGAPGTKRRSPYNSQSDLWTPMPSEGVFSGSSTMPPPPSVPLSSRRASVGSSSQVNDRPVLQKNKSEPPGSLLLKEQMKLLSQQQEQHTQELDKRQSLARKQYHDVLQQYKMQISGQDQLTEADQNLLHAVLSKPILVDILRALLLSLPPSSASTSPSFAQPTPSPLLHTPSPTPTPSSLVIPPPPLPDPRSLLTPTTGGENDPMMQTEPLASPTETVKATEFQSRLLVAAAVQASGGPHSRPSSTPTTTPSFTSPNSSTFMSDQETSPGGKQLLVGATKMKFKTSRGLSSEQKEVYKEIRRQSHISAEQKRRGTIKQGFDQLQSLVIDPSSYPSGKVSKATVLEKTIEFIEHAHHERDHRERQMQALHKEQKELNAAIAKCQENLPASGVPVTRQRFVENRQRFQEYVQKRTLQNYKFWIYSIILQQLFESYNSTVSTGNQDELCRTVLAWFEQNCTLHALRPVVMNSLKELSTKTTILSDPSQVPQQLVQYAKQQLKASHNFDS